MKFCSARSSGSESNLRHKLPKAFRTADVLSFSERLSAHLASNCVYVSTSYQSACRYVRLDIGSKLAAVIVGVGIAVLVTWIF